MKKSTIMLIDDDILFLSLTKKILRSFGGLMKIKCMREARLAREYLDECVANQKPFPNVIFLDIGMPGIGGLEFADLYSKKYHGLFPETRLVILSYSIWWKDKKAALSIPAVYDFLNKPLTEEKLQLVLRP